MRALLVAFSVLFATLAAQAGEVSAYHVGGEGFVGCHEFVGVSVR